MKKEDQDITLLDSDVSSSKDYIKDSYKTTNVNILMMIIGFYVAKFLASGVAQRRCISLECGLQNGTLAIFVGTQLFDNMVYMVPTAAYALIMMTTSVIFVLILRRQT